MPYFARTMRFVLFVFFFWIGLGPFASAEQRAPQNYDRPTVLKTQIVALSTAMQAREADLMVAEHKAASLETQKIALRTHIQDNQKRMKILLLALLRLERAPPQAFIMNEYITPMEAARAHIVLSMMAKHFKIQEKNLKKDMSDLISLQKNTMKEKRNIEKEEAILKKQIKKNNDLLKKKEKFNKKQKDMNNFLENLETSSFSNHREEDVLSSDAPFSLPIAGKVLNPWGALDAFGIPSKGLTIVGSTGGLVVSPRAGVVRFADNFVGYGNLVIVEHRKDVHSLLAGLGKITTVVGQHVEAGEPVGALPKVPRAQLYYELRERGHPINPIQNVGDTP